MRYENVSIATFRDRPNRFVAHVEREGTLETVHVKNTGRRRELLLPGAQVYLAAAMQPYRKTQYDLIAVRKQDGKIVNIDSQAPNRAAREWLETEDYSKIVPEYRFEDSRIDFYMERGGNRCLMEVKGCTLEVDGVGYFPDAPTLRGIKHLAALSRAMQQGFCTVLAYVIQVDGVREVRPNLFTHPEYGAALDCAQRAGVQVLFLPCHVEADSLTVVDAIWAI